ncbi:hypothetical protein G6F46_003119 [Rhizopus delemar]|uniref:DUF171-domain-containing protein n=2 Tax=Rhizopus TaxID=4842 RepID=A0A9P6Z6D8_9FUNG|nr:hypothetical protein G6F55_003195 [Rhizopus delemar]KAG1550587.1 hypothetical protein G6F51_002354 [Rhizopus arrhizus]KAG1495084.1 hypothetical protein G6F54_007420 [Rhizopus delemar]KAG1514287.1 hypothetical protein G6F53_003797 [Rhizopus delemar]KAG1519701.1 hypothetical protein G6F52_008365 [Rhizopus delemar]
MIESKKRRAFENKELSGPDYGKERVVKKQDVKKPLVTEKPRKHTVTIAIPSSVISNAPTLELKTILAGQIARALVLFCVDEVVIYEDKVPHPTSKVNPNLFLARLLQYMETPPYLRKALVPISSDLKFAGLLPSLDVPHHPARDDMTLYREGVTLNKADDQSTLVDVGLFRRARIDRPVQPNVRVTVELSQVVAAADTKKGQKPIQAKVVSPKAPREKSGLYWGYSIRLASSFSKVMTDSPYEYDFLVGVSDCKGDNVYQPSIKDKVKPFEHILIAFGAPNGGLEEAIEADEDLKVGEENANELFDLFIQPLTSGTRSIRLEFSQATVTSFQTTKLPFWRLPIQYYSTERKSGLAERLGAGRGKAPNEGNDPFASFLSKNDNQNERRPRNENNNQRGKGLMSSRNSNNNQKKRQQQKSVEGQFADAEPVEQKKAAQATTEHKKDQRNPRQQDNRRNNNRKPRVKHEAVRAHRAISFIDKDIDWASFDVLPVQQVNAKTVEGQQKTDIKEDDYGHYLSAGTEIKWSDIVKGDAVNTLVGSNPSLDLQQKTAFLAAVANATSSGQRVAAKK